MSWLQGSTDGAPPVDTMQLIRYAKEAGFDSVDVTAYYIPGYENFTLPTKPVEEIFTYVRNIKSLLTSWELLLAARESRMILLIQVMRDVPWMWRESNIGSM